MENSSKSEPTKATHRAYFCARLSLWFFLGAILSSPVTWRSPWPWIPGAFFAFSILSLFILCPILLISGNPKQTKEHQLGVKGLIFGMVALAILGFCISQCST